MMWVVLAGYLYTQMELCSAGNFRKVRESYGDVVSELEIRKFIHAVATVRAHKLLC